MTESIGLAWVTDDHRIRLAELAEDWEEWLPEQLDRYDPDWRDADEAVRAGYLAQLLDEATSPTTGGPLTSPFGPDVLSWVTEEQEASLLLVTGPEGSWQGWLPAALDAQWPQWRQSEPEVLGPWLDSVIERFLAVGAGNATPGGERWEPVDVQRSAADSVPPVDGDASDLSWVTGRQRAALDTARPDRGDWREWLPVELDKLGDWRGSAGPDLAGWLDGVIATLVAGRAADRAEATQPSVADFAERSDEPDGALTGPDPELADTDELRKTPAQALATDAEMAEVVARGLTTSTALDEGAAPAAAPSPMSPAESAPAVARMAGTDDVAPAAAIDLPEPDELSAPTAPTGPAATVPTQEPSLDATREMPSEQAVVPMQGSAPADPAPTPGATLPPRATASEASPAGTDTMAIPADERTRIGRQPNESGAGDPAAEEVAPGDAREPAELSGDQAALVEDALRALEQTIEADPDLAEIFADLSEEELQEVFELAISDGAGGMA